MDQILENLTPFLLYRIIAKIIAGVADQYAELGVSIQEGRSLIVILHEAGISVNELARATCLEQSAVSHLVRHLVAIRLVRRERRADDNRSVKLLLTPEGTRVAKKCYALALKHERWLLLGFKSSEIEVLRRLLRRMFSNTNAGWAAKKTTQPGLTRRSRKSQALSMRGVVNPGIGETVRAGRSGGHES